MYSYKTVFNWRFLYIFLRFSARCHRRGVNEKISLNCTVVSSDTIFSVVFVVTYIALFVFVRVLIFSLIEMSIRIVTLSHSKFSLIHSKRPTHITNDLAFYRTKFWNRHSFSLYDTNRLNSHAFSSDWYRQLC